MPVITASFETIPGTQASEGTSGGHRVIADRPVGVAGGQGLGFNGGQLLALAVGGCICNDLRYVADAQGAALGGFTIHVDLELQDGSVSGIRVLVDGVDNDPRLVEAIVARAAEDSTIVRAVTDGAPVTVVAV